MPKRHILGWIFLLGLLVLLAGCLSYKAEAQSPVKSAKLAQIKKAGVLLVGTSADYPPYEFHIIDDENSEIVGIDIDIAKALAREFGVKLEIRNFIFRQLFEELKDGHIDMAIAGITPHEGRRQEMDFSDIYYQALDKMLVRATDKNKMGYLKDLRGRKVGCQRASIQVDVVKKYAEGAELVERDMIVDLIKALQAGEVDAVIVEKPVADFYVSKNPDIKCLDVMIDPYVPMQGSAIAIKKGQGDFLAEINRVLVKLKQENKIADFAKDADILMDKR